MTWQTVTFPSREQSNADLAEIQDALLQLPQFTPDHDQSNNLQASVRVSFNEQGELEISSQGGLPLTGDPVDVGIGNPYAPGTFILATGRYSVMASELKLVGAQRGILLGNSRLRIT